MRAFITSATVISLLILFACTPNTVTSAEKNPPPSIDVIQQNVLSQGGQAVQGIKVIGLHKERDGAYLVITDRDSNSWGGPYQLLRLESGEWVMTKPGQLFTQYVVIKK